MGQHIGYRPAQVIADELEVKWEDVRLDTPLESGGELRDYTACLYRQQRQHDHDSTASARRCRRPRRTVRRARKCSAPKWRIAVRIEPCHRQGFRKAGGYGQILRK